MESSNYYHPQPGVVFCCSYIRGSGPQTHMAITDGHGTLDQTFHHHSMRDKKDFLESIIAAAEEELNRMKGYDAKTGRYEPRRLDQSDQFVEGDGWRTAYNTGIPGHICGTILTPSEREQARDEGWIGEALA